jgi:hypothetical protein
MKNLTLDQIYRLREQGYPLQGENWLKPAKQDLEPVWQVTRIINLDTLTVAHIPSEVLDKSERSWS